MFCYKYLPRYYTPSIKSFVNNTSIINIQKYITNIDSLEEIAILDKKLKKKWIELCKISKKPYNIKKLQSLEKELKQKWAIGISTQKTFTTVNNALIDHYEKENNYVVDEVDYIDYKNKYNL